MDDISYFVGWFLQYTVFYVLHCACSVGIDFHCYKCMFTTIRLCNKGFVLLGTKGHYDWPEDKNKCRKTFLVSSSLEYIRKYKLQ